VLAIFLGAAAGAWLVTNFGLTLPLVIAGGLILAGTVACAFHPAVRQPATA
jgi:predicted MFS family arabinose efflux permease